MAFARSWFACSNERRIVLYTDAEMTATQSNTVAANNSRSFLRKLIASPPRGVHHRGANLRAANLPTKDQPAIVPPRSNPPVGPVPRRARGHSPHSPPANGKAG